LRVQRTTSSSAASLYFSVNKVIDPSAVNERAIRRYEKVGFKPIGIAQQYEELTRGKKSDRLLMDLIACDLE
jgi:RimJ/RimL family protein N-acetyltransferase